MGGDGEVAPREDKIDLAVFAIELVENFEIVKRPQPQNKEAPVSTATKSSEPKKDTAVSQQT